MLLLKTNSLEFEFDSHLNYMLGYQGMQSGLPVFLAGMNLALSRFSCKIDCLAKSDFSYFTNWRHKIRSHLDRI